MNLLPGTQLHDGKNVLLHSEQTPEPFRPPQLLRPALLGSCLKPQLSMKVQSSLITRSPSACTEEGRPDSTSVLKMDFYKAPSFPKFCDYS